VQSIRKKSFAAEQLARQKKKNPATIAVIVLAVVIAVGAVGYALYVRFVEKEASTEAVSPAKEKTIIAVLPFEDWSDEQDKANIGKGIAESILNKLTNVEQLVVLSRTSSFEFKNIDKPIFEQCKEHDVEWLLEGSVQKYEDMIKITAQLIRVEDQAHIFSEDYDEKIGNVFEIQTRIAEQVLKKLNLTIRDKVREAVAKQYTDDPVAYELFIRGRESKSGTRAASLYEQAIEKDPNFALAYAFLAQVYNRRGYIYWEDTHIPPHKAYPKAIKYAQKALEIDENLCEAFSELAWTSLYYDWDWSEAERYVRKALDLNPGYAQAHHYYRDVCIVMGRWDEAIDEIYEARKYDPIQFQDSHYLASTLTCARRYDEAIEESKRRLALNQNTLSLRGLYWCYMLKGDFNEIVKMKEVYGLFNNSSDNDIIMLSWVGLDCALFGKNDEAMEKIQLIEDYYTKHTAGEVMIAGLYMTLGEFDKTFEWLNKAYKARVSRLTYIYSFPFWEPIRSDPRYKALIKKMGFPE